MGMLICILFKKKDLPSQFDGHKLEVIRQGEYECKDYSMCRTSPIG